MCRECRTVETLPLYEGPQELEAQDPLLDRVVRTHVQLHGELSDGAALLTVSDEPCICPKCKGRQGSLWEVHREEILGGLGERWVGFHPEWYATKDTYAEDAMRCYNLHRRPKGADCIDWEADNRRLTPSHWQKDQHIYLCHFCPVNSAVEFQMNAAEGLYKGRID